MGKLTAHHTIRKQERAVHTLQQLTSAQALQQLARPDGLSKGTRSISASSSRRRASFLPLFHPPQRCSQCQGWVLQMLVPQLLPNRVSTDNLLLAGWVVVHVASRSVSSVVVPCCFHLGCGRRSPCSCPQTCSTGSPTPLPRRPLRMT